MLNPDGRLCRISEGRRIIFIGSGIASRVGFPGVADYLSGAVLNVSGGYQI